MIMVKDKIKVLVDAMPAQEAEQLFTYIISNFQLTSDAELWDAIEEVEPDEVDKQMLNEMQNDPDCNDFE